MELFLNKRGIALETIVKAIPVILMAGILLFIVVQYIEFGSSAVDREACKDSVLLKERSKILGKPLLKDVNCKTNSIEIKSSDENEVSKLISEEMYDCWYQFGEGKRDFLDDWDPWKGDNWCFVCSRIDYNEDTQKKVPQLHLNNYLATQKIPFTEDLTFFEYFYGKDSTLNHVPDTILDTSSPTYILFFADKRLNKEWLIDPTKLDSTDGAFLGGGCVGAGTAGALVGTVIPGVGNVVGAVVGCVGGTIIAGTYEIIFRKTNYISGLYVGSSEEMIEACNQ